MGHSGLRPLWPELQTLWLSSPCVYRRMPWQHLLSRESRSGLAASLAAGPESARTRAAIVGAMSILLVAIPVL